MKKLSIFALVLFSISNFNNANAQDSLFADPVNYSTGYNTRPNNIFASDLDGDSDYDLAVTLGNTNVNNVATLLNNGDGTFQSPVKYTAGKEACSIFAIDLDGDNYNDLTVANNGVNYISILINNGDGTFQDTVNVNTANNPVAIAAADLDGDSDNDLIVVGSYVIMIHLNNGDGTFQNGVQYAVGQWPKSVSVVDLDGDNDNDLAVANGGSYTISVLLNNGDGTFKSGVVLSAGISPISIVGSDLDGDNDNDLALVLLHTNSVLTYINNGDSTFQDTVLSYDAGYHPNAIIAADLDMDDDNDLAVTPGGNVLVFLNNGDGTFQEGVFYGVKDDPSSLFAADLDGDSDIDLAAANCPTDYISIFMNTTITTDIKNSSGLFHPEGFSLSQNYPNPFNPTTKIKYSIPSVETEYIPSVQLKVYDILGRGVATLVNKQQYPGNYEVEFNTNVGANNYLSLPSGVYFYQLKVGDYIQTKKMLLLK